jgi:hypothetical protein
MKSFKEYLTEEEVLDNHSDFISQKTEDKKVPRVMTTRYGNEEIGVHSTIHTDTKRGIAYWGYQVPDKEGNYTDVAPEGVDPELRTARSRTAMGHLVDFAKRNPQTPITYQTNNGEQGNKNHAFFQERWPELQEKHGLSNTLTRVEKNPLRK